MMPRLAVALLAAALTGFSPVGDKLGDGNGGKDADDGDADKGDEDEDQRAQISENKIDNGSCWVAN